MKKIFFLIALFLPSFALAGGFPPAAPPQSSIPSNWQSKSDCSTITAGCCVDTDDGTLYCWDGDSVETQPTILNSLTASDVDDTPENGATTDPVSSNRMYNHEADNNAHIDSSVQTFDPSDTNPDLTGGTGALYTFWMVHQSTAPEITDFDDSDGDYSDFSAGQEVWIYVNYGAIFKFSTKTIRGNADQDFTGSSSNPIWLHFKFTGSTWVCDNLNNGMSDPLTLNIGSIYTSSHSLSTCEGAHDGAGDAATLSDSGESWTADEYIGMTLYNITDGSSCTVTDNDSTTMTCTLAGGTDNDWDASDVWAVAPGPNQSGSIFYITSATTILHPSTDGYMVKYEADGAVVVKVDPVSGSMEIELNTGSGVTDCGAGDEIDSDGVDGSSVTLVNISTTRAKTVGPVGTTWDDGGAS